MQNSTKKRQQAILDIIHAGPVFNQEELALRLKEAGIPLAFVDQKLDGVDYTVYYGANPHEAGRLGAYLLTHRMDVKELAMVRLIRDPRQLADPNRIRRKGFLGYISEHYPHCKVHTVFIHPDAPE